MAVIQVQDTFLSTYISSLRGHDPTCLLPQSFRGLRVTHVKMGRELTAERLVLPTVQQNLLVWPVRGQRLPCHAEFTSGSCNLAAIKQ
jgi:hypothetical protein